MFIALAFVASLIVSSQAAAAPGASIQFKITSPAGVVSCLVANGDADGATVSVAPCDSTLTFVSAWSVEKGAPATGTGPASNIRIHANKCLDVVDGVNADGTKLQVWTCAENSPFQLFNVNPDGHIVWAGKNKCVDVTNGNFGGAQLQVWTCANGNPNQSFSTSPLAPQRALIELLPIRAHQQPSCLTATGTNNGDPVILQLCSGTDLQGWTIPLSAFGPISIGGKCLDVTGGADANGTPLQVWDCFAGSANQKWLYFPNSLSTTPTIQWAHHSRCVNAVNRLTGSPIQLLDCGVGANQTWTQATISS